MCLFRDSFYNSESELCEAWAECEEVISRLDPETNGCVEEEASKEVCAYIDKYYDGGAG